jgi:hypothetical protein
MRGKWIACRPYLTEREIDELLKPGKVVLMRDPPLEFIPDRIEKVENCPICGLVVMGMVEAVQNDIGNRVPMEVGWECGCGAFEVTA